MTQRANSFILHFFLNNWTMHYDTEILRNVSRFYLVLYFTFDKLAYTNIFLILGINF